MAKKRLTEAPRRGQKPKPSSWVRSGGMIGSDAMERLEKFDEEGLGVSEEVIGVDAMPNERVMRKISKRVV